MSFGRLKASLIDCSLVNSDGRCSYLREPPGTDSPFAFAALLVAVFFGVARALAPANYSFLMFAGLIAAGTTGALIRSVIWGVEETAPITSLLLGGVAGFVVGMAYLVPQWVGAPGVLAPSATEVTANDKIQFVSAILVAISAGVGFDTVFTRLKKQAEDQPISATGRKQL